MPKRKLADLVLDFDVYPRNSIDTHHASEMLDAMRNGAALPPIVICRKSKRIVDGFHRQRCYAKLGIEEVDVVEKDYKNDGELFLDSIRYNVGHGLRMDTADKTRCIIKAKDLRVDMTALASAMHFDKKRLGALRETRVATAGTLRHAVPLKRTIQHMAGKQLTKQQEEVNDSLSGMNQVFYANQLIRLIESNLLNIKDERLIERLRVLYELLDGVLAAK